MTTDPNTVAHAVLGGAVTFLLSSLVMTIKQKTIGDSIIMASMILAASIMIAGATLALRP